MSPEHEASTRTMPDRAADATPSDAPSASTHAADPRGAGADSFAERVEALLDAHERERATRLRGVADVMAERDASVTAFERVKPLLTAGLVRPRVEALAARFPNASLEELDSPIGVHTRAVFARTDRAPAKVTLTAGALLDAERRVASVFTSIELIPVLVAVPRGAHRDVSLDVLLDRLVEGDAAGSSAAEWDAVTTWLDEQLLSFLRLYLSIETDPRYQQTAMHVDPVCGMRVQAGNAAATQVRGMHTYFFCSKACAARFREDPDAYLQRAREVARV